MSCTSLRVRELLKSRGWTTKILAEKTGMSESYLTHIKNSTRRWNEDSLKKIAEAFDLEPISLLASYKPEDFESKGTAPVTNLSMDIEAIYSGMKKIPMVGEIPSYPSDYNNKASQITTGYKEMFVPAMNIESDNAFCFVVENQLMSPKFCKGDCLIVVPGLEVKSGDLVAVEYKQDKVYKQLMIVSFSENLILLEHVNHKQAPVAIIKNRDYCRIIGKVTFIYQKLS